LGCAGEKGILRKTALRCAVVILPISETGFNTPRQNNDFYHLCGIETPHSYLALDGRREQVTLYLAPRNTRIKNAECQVLSADDADLVKRLTGVDE